METELSLYYVTKSGTGCVDWVNNFHNDAWDKMVVRFEDAIEKTFDTRNWELGIEELNLYKKSCKKWIDEFKKNNDDIKDQGFFDSLELLD